MTSDFEILRRANDRENDSRDPRLPENRCWESRQVGATRTDIIRLLDEGLIYTVFHLDGSYTQKGVQRYRLTRKGKELVWASQSERKREPVSTEAVLDALGLVVGFDDIKQILAGAIAARRKTNFLLEGPPACAKSVILEGIRSAVPDAYIAFGSRTSAPGLSDVLFERQPSILLMDEADKMHADCYSVCLGLMETGDILETKSQKVRGIKLDTMVIAACNRSEKMPAEFLSRFALHVKFPLYSRQEFIEVCCGFLTRAESCGDELAEYIATQIYDNDLGDVRKARSVWQLINAPTAGEVQRVIATMLKYNPGRRRATAASARMI
jgi:hypothetical protein